MHCQRYALKQMFNYYYIQFDIVSIHHILRRKRSLIGSNKKTQPSCGKCLAGRTYKNSDSAQWNAQERLAGRNLREGRRLPTTTT